MKTKVLAFIVAVMVCAGAIPTRATDANWLGNPRAEDTLHTFWGFVMRLEVTDTQKTQIKALLTEQQQESARIRNNASLTPKAQQSRIETLIRSTHQKVLAKLTQQQRQQLQGMAGFQP
jgi:Spy/CpxP family protein refolding chaperone